MMLKFCFDKLCSDLRVITFEDTRKLLAANLIPLDHAFVLALLDDFKEERAFTYSMVVELFTRMKSNIEDNTLDERLTLFKEYDRDNNGFINKSDLRTCLAEDGYYKKGELDDVINLVMHLGDANHDGKLSYIEFLEMLGKPDLSL